jgi:RNA polymerase primary sigma factor
MVDEEEYHKELKDCLPIMKLSQKVGRLSKSEKKQALDIFFDLKYLMAIYLLYYRVDITSKSLIQAWIWKKKIQDMLVLKDLRLIIKTVNHPRFTGQGIPLSDLIGYGICGYIYALDVKFDPSRGNQLSTCAVPWISQRAQRAIEYYSKCIRLPNHIYSEISKVNMVVRQYVRDNAGENPNAEEIAVRLKQNYNLDWTVEHIQDLGNLRKTHTSTDEKTAEDGSNSIIDFISESGEEEIVEKVEKSMNNDYLYSLLEKLNHNEQKLINWKWGLIDKTPRTNAEMAVIMGMEKLAFSKFEKQTMDKLRSLADREKVNL